MLPRASHVQTKSVFSTKKIWINYDKSFYATWPTIWVQTDDLVILVNQIRRLLYFLVVFSDLNLTIFTRFVMLVQCVACKCFFKSNHVIHFADKKSSYTTKRTWKLKDWPEQHDCPENFADRTLKLKKYTKLSVEFPALAKDRRLNSVRQCAR